jgi:hypothetical protein
LRRVLALVEGQTEERFAKAVLQPHLLARGVHLQPTILTTKRLKNGPDFKGGIASFAQVRRDLAQLLRDTNASLVTTMFDLYGLPADWPAHASAAGTRGAQRAETLEAALQREMGNPRRFRPFLMAYEFEAMLYCDVQQVAATLNAPHVAHALLAERDAVGSPEDINDGSTTHPSCRISTKCPHYRKVLHGSIVTGKVGLDAIREQCPHFDEWVAVLETA